MHASPGNMGFHNFPPNTFANKTSAPKDFNRINMMRDRGTIYQPNGAGRDGYIFMNNGGFAHPKEPRKQFHPGTMYNQSLHAAQKREKFPHLHSRPVHYKEDGTGRDTYILTGHGGLEHSSGKQKEYRSAFKDSLRTYPINDFYLQKRQQSKSPP